MACPRYAIQKDRARDYSVWVVSPHTGSKVEPVASFTTRVGARTWVRKKQHACDGLGRARRRR